jgi:hypothetical protein
MFEIIAGWHGFGQFVFMLFSLGIVSQAIATVLTGGQKIVTTTVIHKGRCPHCNSKLGE